MSGTRAQLPRRGLLRRLRRQGNPLTGPIEGHIDAVNAVATLSLPDGRTLLATTSSDRTVRLWDPVTGAPHGDPLTGHTSEVTAVAAVPLPDGRTLLATTSADQTVRLWCPATGHCVHWFSIMDSGVGLASIGSRLAVATSQGLMVVEIAQLGSPSGYPATYAAGSVQEPGLG